MNPALGRAVVSAGAGRLRHQGRPRADAHLAAGRAQRKSGADFGDAVGRAAQQRHARHRALSDDRRRGAERVVSRATTLVAFGVVSLLVGALFIVRQNGIKRLMAYSSVEHMGVIALGFGFGGPLGVAGALYHMLNHSLNKSLMFFGAGNVMRSYGTKEIRSIRGVWARFPVQGALWLAGAAAITGAPPFGLFLSELVILRAGFERGYAWAVYAMIVLLIVIFIGFLNHFRTMYFDADARSADRATPISRWCVTPMWLALAPLLVFGVWWPSDLWDHFMAAARLLTGPTP